MFLPARSTKVVVVTVSKSQAAHLHISEKERLKHLCLLQCAEPGATELNNLLVPMTEIAITGDTTAQTPLTQESLF